MTTLTDLIGADTQPWMSASGRNCDTSGLEADPKVLEIEANQWFPTDKNETAELAKKMCAGCPVVLDCLSYAMDRPAEEGIWGGTTTIQRNNARRRRAAA